MALRGRRPGLARFFTLGVGLLAACSSPPTAVVIPPMEAIAAGGDGQYGTVGQTLQNSLQVVVRTISTQLPRVGATVNWSVESGAATLIDVPSAVTDSTGSAMMRVRLGATTGEVSILASIVVEGLERTRARFTLFTVDRPVLDALSPTSAAPGETVTLTGSNFSPNAEQNVVLFSGVRGVVTAATMTQLSVTVPACLPQRSVSVRTQLGTVASGSRLLSVGAGGTLESLQVGDVLDLDGDEGFDCRTVPGDGTASYLVQVQSASTVGAAAYPYQLSGLGATSPLLASGRTMDAHTAETRPRTDPMAAMVALEARSRRWDFELGDPQSLLDERLRELEEIAIRSRPTSSEAPHLAVEPPAPVPAVNDTRTFQVFRSGGGFTEVDAVARVVGARAALFVDEEAPAAGYTTAELQAFSDQFDDVIYPVVTSAFGQTSDLDANQRIVILFTPQVNALTARGSSGFVGGFFFGLDLLPESQGSNGGEVFYAVVPDPSGEFSDPRTKARLLEVTPAVLAHEFQHMVNFNERILIRGAESNEAIWLSEGLAQYAEELVAREYERQADPPNTTLFRAGVQDRSRRYLVGTDSVSLIVTMGSGSLSERGADFLYVTYLADRFGADLPGRLTRTTRTGVANVEAETAAVWRETLSDWWSAVYLDGPGSESGPRVYPTVDLRGFLGNPYPLVPTDLGSADFTEAGMLRSSSVAYYIVTPEAGGSTTLRLGGEGGGTSASQAAIRMRIVRVQ